MKRIILAAVAAMMIGVPSLFSQQLSVNKSAILKKIERSDQDIANAKKAVKAATWITRGDAMYEAATAISSQLSSGMDPVMFKLTFGTPLNEESVTVAGTRYIKMYFPYMEAYAEPAARQLVTWKVTEVIYPDALAKAAEAYEKAYELEPSGKNAEKVQTGLSKVFTEYYNLGTLAYSLREYNEAAADFDKAFHVAELKGVDVGQGQYSAIMRDAGLAYYFANEFQKSVDYFNGAIENNFDSLNDGDGQIYYFLYHAYKGLATAHPVDSAEYKEYMETGKNVLETGISKFPMNTDIIESLTDAYVTMGEDPNAILPIVQDAVDRDPNNAALWSGLGVIYDRLGMSDESMKMFEKVAELTPNDFNAFNNLGILYINKADRMLDEFNKNSGAYTTAEYDEQLNKINDVYQQSITPLEKAYSLNPNNTTTLELLKAVTFRLRAREGMQEKNTKYDAEYKKLTGQQ